MALGNVGKASADQFVGVRKLLMVPLVSALSPDREVQDLATRYWTEVKAQVQGLQNGLGTVSHIYHEGCTEKGEEGLALLKKGSPEAFPLLQEISNHGAEVRLTEDRDALLETMDLQKCLMIRLNAPNVVERILEWYRDAQQRRYANIAQAIDGTLEKGQVGLLLISQDHQVQFPTDIQVFYVAPPTLEAINRLYRERQVRPGSPPQEDEPLDPEDGPEPAEEPVPPK